MKGTVKRWLLGRGYGFIQPDEGEKDVFVHYSDIGGEFELKGCREWSSRLRTRIEDPELSKSP